MAGGGDRLAKGVEVIPPVQESRHHVSCIHRQTLPSSPGCSLQLVRTPVSEMTSVMVAQIARLYIAALLPWEQYSQHPPTGQYLGSRWSHLLVSTLGAGGVTCWSVPWEQVEPPVGQYHGGATCWSVPWWSHLLVSTLGAGGVTCWSVPWEQAESPVGQYPGVATCWSVPWCSHLLVSTLGTWEQVKPPVSQYMYPG